MSGATEAHAAGRQAILRAVDGMAPGIVGNPYVPEWPTPRQLLFLGLHRTAGTQHRVWQALYGGAAGGGKSSALLMAMAQQAHLYPGSSAIAFRRSYTDLTQPGALLDRAMQWWIPAGVAWNGTRGLFTFPNGSRVAMSYLWGPQDHLRYQGAEYQLTCWDELTQWATPAQYEYVGLSRVRRSADSKVPLRTLCASNPGGPGHEWVKRIFVGGLDADGRELRPEHAYVPSTLADNPHLDRDSYAEGLASLHPTVRAQLLRGDWDARDPGDYFRREWFGDLLTERWPANVCARVRWWDLAASERPDAARTAGVLMARSQYGVRAVEHAVAFRATPGRRDDLIVQQAQIDGKGVTVGIEIEGGSGGLAQFLALEKRLRAAGYRVAGARPAGELDAREARVLVRSSHARASKMTRADPVASCLERGYQRRGEGVSTGAAWWGVDAALPPEQARDGIRLLAGDYVQSYIDELEGFPDGATVDLVDATTGAWAWLEAHPAGGSRPARPIRALAVADGPDVHPDARQRRTDWPV